MTWIYSTSITFKSRAPQRALWEGQAVIWHSREQYRVSAVSGHAEHRFTPIFLAQFEHSTTRWSLPRWSLIFCSTLTTRWRSGHSPCSISAFIKYWAFFLVTNILSTLQRSFLDRCLFVRGGMIAPWSVACDRIKLTRLIYRTRSITRKNWGRPY